MVWALICLIDRLCFSVLIFHGFLVLKTRVNCCCFNIIRTSLILELMMKFVRKLNIHFEIA